MELENIDDDCDQNDIAFVKIDDDNEAAEWGIDEIPTIVSVFAFYLLFTSTSDEDFVFAGQCYRCSLVTHLKLLTT